MKRAFLIVCVMAWVGQAQAAVHTESVEYRDGDAALEGFLAYDDALKGPRPGVLVVHEWKGLNEYAKRRATQLAELGYIAFAADMYGKGILAKDHEEAGRLSGLYRNDRPLARRRVRAGFDVLKQHPLTDPMRIAAIGYCFGGMSVLELARSGADVLGVVTFHGALDSPTPEDAKHIKGKVLVLHGAADGYVMQDKVAAFEREMTAAGADYRVIQYPGAAHGFTVPEAGDNPASGMAYNAPADRVSWEEMKAFFKQIFAEPEGRTIG